MAIEGHFPTGDLVPQLKESSNCLAGFPRDRTLPTWPCWAETLGYSRVRIYGSGPCGRTHSSISPWPPSGPTRTRMTLRCRHQSSVPI
jgi:hypothetical protein